MNKDKILKQFLKYISIDTTSDSAKDDTPSSNGQIKLAKLLKKQLDELNVNTYFDEKYCYLYGKLKGNKNSPKIGFVSHLDTTEFSNSKIEVNVIKNYDGKDIILNKNKILSRKISPELKNYIGKTLITTNGKSILGADNKAGIVEIINMIKYFVSSNNKHGDIYICFTPDEEIGLSAKHINKKYFNPDFAYIVDGSTVGEISYKNFNAIEAIINIEGEFAHYGTAKNIMINASYIAMLFSSLIPTDRPENTYGDKGFYHLKSIKGDVVKCTVKYLICDFDKRRLEKRKKILLKIIKTLNKKYDNCIKFEFSELYSNMISVMKKEKRLIHNTMKAISKTKIKPKVILHRGGTDGIDISHKGIPCLNIGTGVHNYHSVYEYICLEDIVDSIKILISIVEYFYNE